MSLISMGNTPGRPDGIVKGGDNEDNPILTLMRDRFEHIISVDAENRNNYVQNVRISSSNDQWDEEVKKRRGSNRPALTFNLLNGVVKQIIGDYRQNKLAIKVLPSGGQATEDVAEILAAIIRGIETDSNADHSYTNALECAARGGFGYFRVRAMYESDDVFNQKLVIEPIYNPLTVYFDPAAKRITREDAEYCIVTEMLSKSEFRRLYPKAEENGWDLVDITSDNMEDWGDDDNIRIAEYFVKETVEERLVAFSNGSVIQIDNDDEIAALAQIGITPVKERMAERVNIKWYKCTGSAILEQRTFKTKYIPIIPVLGEEVNLEGKTLLRSSVFYGVDAQRSYNYERSAAVERSALAAKAPWLVTNKMIEMWRALWDNANTTPQPYLVYTPDQSAGGPPQRIEPPSTSQAEMANSQIAAQDVQRTTLVFNSQLGANSNIQSGVGLSEQQSQGATSTFIFPDNLRCGIEHCGRVLIDAIPFFYDRERVVRTINSEDVVEMQTVNQQQPNMLLGITEVLNDITVGKYDVVVTAGKAFASRRREAVEGMMKFAQAFPQQAPIIADLMIKNMDVPGGDQMAARIKRSLPPQIVNDPDSPEGQQAAQQAQQQQQMQAQMAQQHMQVAQGKVQAEQGKNQATMVKAQAEVVKAKADAFTAVTKAHSDKVETAMNMLDSSRMGNEQAPTSPQGMQFNIVRSPDEIQHAQTMHDGLSAIAQHLAASHDHHAQSTDATHELLAHLVNGQQALGEHMAHGHALIAGHMERANRIAESPTEAIRDRAGKMIGSRKKVAE